MNFGRYEDLVEIGRGGMGVVYKAYHPYFKEAVALKTMSSELSTDAKFREKFFEEGRSIRRLRHENIVQIFDMDEADGRPYLTMELLDGNSLKERMYGRTRMPLELRLRIMMEICKGLAYAHEMGIIHRDIKPENIYITTSEQVKILDFGLARAAAAVTQGSQVMGTVYYMSPEHWQKKEDHRSDIFAAGAVFYELLSLKRAFNGDNPLEVMRKVVQVDPEPIHKINPTIPEQLSTIILKALSKTPNDRYQKMDVFLGELEKFAKSLDELKAALQKQNAEVIAQLSRLIAANKDLVRIDELKNIKQNWPFILRSFETLDGNESPTIYQPRLSYFELLEDCEKATREYELLRALVETRRETSPILNQAFELKKSGQFEAARETVERILQVDPGNTEARSLHKEVSARIEEERVEAENARRAAELFEQALSPSFDNDPKGCLALLDEVLRLKPGYEAATALREKVQRKIKEQQELEKKRSRAQEAMEAARQSLQIGDLKLARKAMEMALAECPDAEGVEELRGAIERAEEELRAQKELENRKRKLLEEALAFDERGEDEGALARVSELLAVEPTHQQALDLKKKVEKRSKLRKQAQDLFERAGLKHSSGDFRGSLKLLNEVLRLDPRHQAAGSLREEVQQTLKEMTELSEKRHQAERALSAALRSLSKEEIDQARVHVEKARSIYPELPRIADVESRIERVAAEAAAKKEREKQVRRLLEEAQSLVESGGDAMALDRLNELLSLAPRHIGALRLKREIVTRRQALERADAVAQNAKAKLLSNDVSGCLRLLDEVLKLQPGYPPAVSLREDAVAKIKEQAEEENRRQAEEALAAAQKALTAGDFERAREETERAKAFDSNLPRISVLLDEIDHAEEKLRAARERELRKNKLWEEAHSLTNAGEEEMALSRIGELLALEPAHPQALELKKKVDKRLKLRKQTQDLFEKARLKYSSGDFRESLKLLNEVLRLDPRHQAAASLREEVQQTLNEMTELSHRRHQAEQALSAALRSLSKEEIEQARVQVEKARSIYPELRRIADVESRIERVIEEAAAKREREEQVRRLLEEARSLVESGEDTMALDRLNQLLSLVPRDTAALRLKREIETRRQALERADALVQNAKAKLLSNDVSGCLRLLDEALKLQPDYPPAVGLREDALERIKQQAEEENRRQAEEALTAGQKALKAGDFDRAREETARAKAFDSKLPRISVLLDEIDFAEEQLRAAKERELRRNKLWEEAQSLTDAAEEEMALSRIGELLALEPAHIPALKLKGEIEGRLRGRVGAEELFQKARLAFSSGKLQECLELLEDALKLQPNHSAAVILRDVVRDRIREETDIEANRREAEQVLASARRALAVENFKQAREETERARKLCPELPDISLLLESIERAETEQKRKARETEGEREKQLGLKLRQEKMLSESLAALRRAELLLPGDTAVREAIIEVRAAMQAEELRVRIQTAIVEARKLLTSEEFDAAREKLLWVLEVASENLEAKELLSRIDQDEQEKTRQNRIVALRAQSQQAFIEEDFNEASILVEQWLLLDPLSTEARELRGRVGEAQAEKERKAQLARRALLKAALRVGVGVLAVALLAAVVIWTTGLMTSADFNRRTEAHFKNAEYEEAQRTLNEWVLKYPENIQARELQRKVTRMQDNLKNFEIALRNSNYEQASGFLLDMENTNPDDKFHVKRRQRLEEAFSPPFQDEFLQGLEFWNHPESWRVDDGKLTVRGSGLGLLSGKYYKDFEAQFKITFTNDKGAVWILRAKDKNNCYMFQLTGPRGIPANSFAASKFVNGERKSVLGPILVGANLGEKDDQFTIIIKANGKTISHEIQIVSAPLEEPRSLAVVDDLTFSGGSIGFGTKDGEEFIVRSLKILPSTKNR